MNYFVVMNFMMYMGAGLWSLKTGEPKTAIWFGVLYISYAVSCVALIMIERNRL